MKIFDYTDEESLGKVRSVDTATVIVQVEDVEKLRRLQVNRLAVLQSSRPGQHLIGLIQKITRTAIEGKKVAELAADDENVEGSAEINLVKISLIGTVLDKQVEKENVFTRTLETVPEIDANCFAVEGNRLTNFMRIVGNISAEGQRLSLGTYTLDDKAEAFLNGNKFFQRHAIIVGSTGSGKSWATARILEQLAELPNANALVFDIHGEYGPLQSNGIRHLRIAGPSDLDQKGTLANGVLYLPFWLLGYEAMLSMFVDRSDQNAPNQAMIMSRTIIEAKREYLISGGHKDVLDNFTIDSPVPFSVDDVLKKLGDINVEMVAGARAGTEKAGDFNGKLSRLIQRLENKAQCRFEWNLTSHNRCTNTP